MRKLIIFIILFSFTPIYAHALILQQQFITFTIIVNTEPDVEGFFNFNVSTYQFGSNGLLQFTPIDSFDLKTTNSTVSKTLSLPVGYNFQVSEAPRIGLGLINVTCDDPSTGSGKDIYGARFTTREGVNITCVYNNSSFYRDPVLIVPGVLGTEILKDNQELWPDIDRLANPFINDNFLDPLSFDKDLHPTDTSLSLGMVIRNKVFVAHYTDNLINSLVDQGYTEGEDLFTFPYDWRYGVSGTDENGKEVNIEALRGQINYILNQTTMGQIVGSVDVIAHSTGGLLLKKYISEYPNDHGIYKAIFVGTPNLGAPKAYKVLLAGDSFNVPGLSAEEMKKLSLNMPVVYDLAANKNYYDLTGDGMIVKYSSVKPSESLGYSAMVGVLQNNKLVNPTAVAKSNQLRTSDFENLDVRNFGVDAYNFVGCKTATIDKITMNVDPFTNNLLSYDLNKVTAGDGTVPFVSANSIPVYDENSFYVPKADHGTLMTSKSVVSEVLNTVVGTELDTKGIVSHKELAANPKLCQIKGELIKIKSPVQIDVTDQDGNHSGLFEDGSIENSIPGADYEIWGEHKYVFLPTDEDQSYNINLKGTDNGTFTVEDETIVDDQSVNVESFENLPVTTNLQGTLDISGEEPKLILDQNGDGSVDAVLNPGDSITPTDALPPITSGAVSGTEGSAGYFRSDISLILTAADPGENASGVLNTRFSLDGSDFADYTTPVTVATEGSHIVKFYSTDHVGNTEPEQSLQFTIDKTAPELNFTFDPSKMDIVFTGSDNLSSSNDVTVLDSDSLITATDQAGNVTALTLKSKNRKKSMSAEIQSLTYNGVKSDTNKTNFRFIWNIDKKTGTLKNLEQIGRSKKDFTISATYANGKTLLLGRDSNGLIFSYQPGLVALRFATDDGDISWSK